MPRYHEEGWHGYRLQMQQDLFIKCSGLVRTKFNHRFQLGFTKYSTYTCCTKFDLRFCSFSLSAQVSFALNSSIAFGSLSLSTLLVPLTKLKLRLRLAFIKCSGLVRTKFNHRFQLGFTKCSTQKNPGVLLPGKWLPDWLLYQVFSFGAQQWMLTRLAILSAREKSIRQQHI